MQQLDLVAGFGAARDEQAPAVGEPARQAAAHQLSDLGRVGAVHRGHPNLHSPPIEIDGRRSQLPGDALAVGRELDGPPVAGHGPGFATGHALDDGLAAGRISDQGFVGRIEAGAGRDENGITAVQVDAPDAGWR